VTVGECHVNLKGQDRDPITFRAHNLGNGIETDLVTIEHLFEMVPEVSNSCDC